MEFILVSNDELFVLLIVHQMVQTVCKLHQVPDAKKT